MRAKARLKGALHDIKDLATEVEEIFEEVDLFSNNVDPAVLKQGLEMFKERYEHLVDNVQELYKIYKELKKD